MLGVLAALVGWGWSGQFAGLVVTGTATWKTEDAYRRLVDHSEFSFRTSLARDITVLIFGCCQLVAILATLVEFATTL